VLGQSGKRRKSVEQIVSGGQSWDVVGRVIINGIGFGSAEGTASRSLMTLDVIGNT
jgi:hypothetical protein